MKFYLCGEVNPESIGKLKKEITDYLELGKGNEIDLCIETNGGEMYSAFGFYDFMRFLEPTIKFRTYCFGSCMSAGIVLFLASEERYIGKNSRLMFHSALVSDYCATEYSFGEDFKQIKICNKKVLDLIIKILKDKKNITNFKNSIANDKDYFIDSKMAIKLGLANYIV